MSTCVNFFLKRLSKHAIKRRITVEGRQFHHFNRHICAYCGFSKAQEKIFLSVNVEQMLTGEMPFLKKIVYEEIYTDHFVRKKKAN